MSTTTLDRLQPRVRLVLTKRCCLQYPGIFGDVLDILKPILDIWGLLFRALGPSECFGIQGFASSWLLRVIGLPAIMSTVVLIIFLVDRSRALTSPAEAAMAAKANFFFVVFFTYILR